MARSPAVSHVQGRSITLAELHGFDAYYDFSSLLLMEGYNDIPLIDFFLNQLGIDPASVNADEKVPQLRLPSMLIQEAKKLIDHHRQGRKVVLVQGQASTPLRSMPDGVMVQLMGDILSKTDAYVLLTHPVSYGPLEKYADRIIQMAHWCQTSTDHYLALVVAVDALVSIDSLAIHAAAAARIPGIVIFTTLEPNLRLAYAPCLTGLLIPGATILSTWGKHKIDSHWSDEQIPYNQAWEVMDRVPILDKLIFLLSEKQEREAHVQSPAVESWPSLLAQAQQLASQACFDDCMVICQRIVNSHLNNADALLSVGSLLLSFGFLTAAHKCFVQACTVAPNDLRPIVNLANLAREAGDHSESRRLYTHLLERIPNKPLIRRNALLSLEYDPDASAEERLSQARAWGDWAIASTGGPRKRPALRVLRDGPLRIGYVSADFCQHTVGLFVKDILTAHCHERVKSFAYSAGQMNDWVTAAIRKACTFREVAALDDAALAEQIRQDEIDVLIDLSGHTAGSRLTVFAYRPAPVQVSWLGYFATTGLPVMDAVLMDDWHAPAGAEAQFVEPIIRLPRGRFCYTPVPFAPAEVAPAPCLTNGYVTFGCFNNSAKLNAAVYETWAQILAAVPDSRLVLKWRTFQDAGLSQSVQSVFGKLDIAPERIELRGASFHADVLKQYADIDIALDSFPFTGGLTSCEALWMGVPVVTWPQSHVVSRQTFAFLSAIGLPELAGQSRDDYVRIAVALAENSERLGALRSGMRQRMLASPLCDVGAFTYTLEDTLLALVTKVAASSI